MIPAIIPDYGNRGLLMKKAVQVLAFVLVALAFFLLGLWALGWIPTYANYCEYNQYTEHEKCTSYYMPITVIRYLGWFLDVIAPAITAIATGFVGWFTATIWIANKEQIRHNRQTERAYLWPGFASHLGRRFPEEGRSVWNISLLNTGRTAGIITEIHHALVSEADYAAGRFRYTRVPDRGEIIPPGRPGGETPSGIIAEVREGAMISCGYIVYTDIYRDTHEQAWKHRLHAVGASEPLPRCYSDPPIKITRPAPSAALLQRSQRRGFSLSVKSGNHLDSEVRIRGCRKVVETSESGH